MRPPLEPRLKKLEDELAYVWKRVELLEKQILAMNDAFAHGNIPRPQYESQFTVWPGANSNGSR